MKELARNILLRFPEVTNCAISTYNVLNHYHWIYDTILPLLASQNKDPINVPKRITQNHIEILRVLGLKNDLIIGGCSSRRSNGPHKNYFKDIGLLVEASLNITGKTDKNKPKKLYLTRQGCKRRRLLNEQEIIDHLTKHGFTAVNMSEISFIEQLEYFYNAQVVIGVHGAAFSNLFAATQGTKVIELLPELDFSDAIAKLCWSLNLPYVFTRARTKWTNLNVNPLAIEELL